MEFKLFLDKDRKEEIIVYAQKETPLIKEIKELVESNNTELLGYCENDTVRLSLRDVYCFTIEKNKLYAITENESLLIKLRLYQVEELINNDFVKINQSSIANIKKIDRFDASIGGTLIVKFKNGYKDYVSRRQIKFVKERIGQK